MTGINNTRRGISDICMSIKKMHKKLIAMLLAVLMSGMWAGGVYTAYAEQDVDKISLQELYEIAVNNSIQIKIDDINVLLKEDALNQAKERAMFLGDAYGAARVLDNRITKEVVPFERETDVEQAKRKKEDDISSLKLSLYKTALNLELAKKELELEKKRLDLMLERYELMKAKKQQGSITESSLTDYEYNIESKRIDIAKAEEKVESVKNEIKRIAGISYDEILPEIDIAIVYEPLVNVNVNDAIRSCIENDTNVYIQTRNIQALEKRLELTGIYYGESSLEYKSRKYELEKAKLSLEQMKTELEVRVRNGYSNLLNQKDRVLLAQSYLELVQKKLKDVELKYDNGFATKETVINARESYMNAEYQLYSAIYNYIIMKSDFINLCKL